ncbi:DUF3954 domain-containing protein [Terrihalobacillus insolitus]|uniref:DUF3954 domain-containing protein n=1 Tax=Terrihalobacillus insolitus TaxID=2950438 RepID=UPI00233FDCB2|nr:DUF3954 domain-containing protein [Terrihalobacillus insolitus]MDC3414284.1 DUF3954 domain-containing protein [Terrihalobacillus insolitus]
MAKTDFEKMVAEIDLKEDAVYRIKDGKIDRVDMPETGYGKQVITWQDGKPSHYEVSYTKK